jgi:hypothetical protein
LRIFKNQDKRVLIQCPYASDGTKDFCSPKKPYTLDMASPDFQQLMEEHVQRHVERDSSLFGLTIKRLGCSICSWESKPFQSNNATKLKALGREEMEAMIDLDDHLNGNEERVTNLKKSVELMKQMREMADGEQDLDKRDKMLQQLADLGSEDDFLRLIEDYSGHLSCELHETPGHEVLVYYFRDKEEQALHNKLLHLPKIKPINPKLRKQ